MTGPKPGKEGGTHHTHTPHTHHTHLHTLTQTHTHHHTHIHTHTHHHIFTYIHTWLNPTVSCDPCLGGEWHLSQNQVSVTEPLENQAKFWSIQPYIRAEGYADADLLFPSYSWDPDEPYRKKYKGGNPPGSLSNHGSNFRRGIFLNYRSGRNRTGIFSDHPTPSPTFPTGV